MQKKQGGPDTEFQALRERQFEIAGPIPTTRGRYQLIILGYHLGQRRKEGDGNTGAVEYSGFESHTTTEARKPRTGGKHRQCPNPRGIDWEL